MAVAGTRYTYPSAIGVAFLAVGLFELVWRRAPLRAARAALVVGFAVWIAVQVVSVRSVERWRYERRCDRLASLLDGTRTTVLQHPGAGGAVMIAPDIWNALDYQCALYVFLDLAPGTVHIEYVPLAALRDRLTAGGDLDPAANAVFTSFGDAEVVGLSSADDAPWERWEEVAAEQAEFNRGGMVPIVFILAPH